MIRATTTGEVEEILRFRAKQLGLRDAVNDEMKQIASDLKNAALVNLPKGMGSTHATSGQLESGLSYEITVTTEGIEVRFVDSAIYAGVQEYGAWTAVIVPEHTQSRKEAFGKEFREGPKEVIIRQFERKQNITGKHFIREGFHSLPTIKDRLTRRVEGVLDE